MNKKEFTEEIDVLLIGAGIMSATIGSILKELNPQLNIKIVERLTGAALESSEDFSNAGTGHAGFCELNYTPEKDGNIDISKAIKVNEEFELSLQYWSYLVRNNKVKNDFIKKVPHMSMVKGQDNITFLKKRYEALKLNHLFEDIQYSDDINKIKEWCPLLNTNKKNMDSMAVTRIERGTDVNFGALTRQIIEDLQDNNVDVKFNHEVVDLSQVENYWLTKVKDLTTGKSIKIKSKYVFIGAGGFSLTLLEQANVKESKGYGGFPISGQWLVCKNKDIIKQHNVKVYGKAASGTPPMSVPHLDTRIINGEKCLLFGPFAGFTTKFLKHGSAMDLIKSIKTDNVLPMAYAAAKNLGLTKYLVKEVVKSYEEKFQSLLEFYPEANINDWEIAIAGQRVQIIKKDEKEGGKIEFGTEVIISEDKTISAVLGASPGASTSVAIVLDLIEKCFKDDIDNYDEKITQMIPSYKKSLSQDKFLFYKTNAQTSAILNLI